MRDPQSINIPSRYDILEAIEDGIKSAFMLDATAILNALADGVKEAVAEHLEAGGTL